MVLLPPTLRRRSGRGSRTMVLLTPPKYTVINPNPTNVDVVMNFSMMDMAKWVGATAVSLPYGYAAGIRPKIPVQSMCTAGLIGFSAGYLLAYQQSWGRLVGRVPN
eukprot:CAMPEP_0198712776 /NCGR_PEP_ID=MMETSP1471-20131121/4469_1 /TAXON_ID=41880 /ORGANISM="Pycnococcus provasolii, Strain RCC733" /LENGTH=105 /DNA_ID=CAMNT_0044472771 /DNA_START=12 /DNA_END=329 /DNA_ORIENTATION=-